MKRETVVGLAAVALAVPAPAQEAAPALSSCGPRAEIVAQLAQKWGERRVGAGLQNRGMVTEVFASPETGTWTILQTRPDGVACARAAGEAWMSETPPAGDPS